MPRLRAHARRWLSDDNLTDTAALVQELYPSFAEGDIPSVLAGVDPKIEWNEAEHVTFWPCVSRPRGKAERMRVAMIAWDGGSNVSSSSCCAAA